MQKKSSVNSKERRQSKGHNEENEQQTIEKKFVSKPRQYGHHMYTHDESRARQPSDLNLTDSSSTLPQVAGGNHNEIEQKYMQILRKYKDLKTKTAKNSDLEIKDLKYQAQKVKDMEAKLKFVVDENEQLRQKIAEIDMRLKERETGHALTVGIGDEVKAKRAKDKHELQMKELKEKIRLTEERCSRELREKELEYKDKLARSASKYELRERELKSRIKELKRENDEVERLAFEDERDEEIDQDSFQSRGTKSDRTPSPLVAKKPTFSSKFDVKSSAHIKHIQSIKSRPSDLSHHSNTKNLEALIVKILDDYKSIKKENKNVSTKLDQIQSTIQRYDNLNSRIEHNYSKTPNRTTIEQRQQSNTPDRADPNRQSFTNAYYIGRTEDSVGKSSSYLRHEKQQQQMQRYHSNYNERPPHKAEFFETRGSSGKRAAPGQSKGSRFNEGNVIFGKTEWTEPTQSTNYVADKKINNQYSDFIEQFARMKDEIRHLNEENEELANFIKK